MGFLSDIVGGVADFAGDILGEVTGSNDAAEAAAQQRRQAEEASDDVLAFQRERQTRWESVFGNVQENLAETVMGIDPQTLAGTQLSAFNSRKVLADKRIRETLAQRGLQDSGLEASLMAQSELNAAQTRAGIEAQAPHQARQIQENFLRIGLGQNPAGQVGSVLANQASTARSQAAAATQASAQAAAANRDLLIQAGQAALGGGIPIPGSGGGGGSSIYAPSSTSAANTNSFLYGSPAPQGNNFGPL